MPACPSVDTGKPSLLYHRGIMCFIKLWEYLLSILLIVATTTTTTTQVYTLNGNYNSQETGLPTCDHQIRSDNSGMQKICWRILTSCFG